MSKFIQRTNENLEVIKSIVSIANNITMESDNHNLSYVPRLCDSNRFIKIIMLSREIYIKWLNDFITVSRMAEYYDVSLNALNRIIAIGRHSSKNHNYILKYYS